MIRSKLLKRMVLNKGAYFISLAKLVPLLLRLNKRSVVIDCGANVGDITRLFALTGARVYAFEPDRNAFQVLSRRFGNRKNVQCINKGVWDRNGQVSLYAHRDQQQQEVAFTVGSSIKNTKVNVDASKYETIEVIDFTDFLQSLHCKVDLVKMDVEGAETDILKKLLQTGGYKCFDRMYVETHETKIPEQAAELVAIRQQMQQLGVTNIRLNWI